MTTITPKALFEGTALTTTPVALYTSPANTKTSIQSANVVNTGNTALLTVYIVPSGGSANAASCAIASYSMATGATYQCPELINQVLEAGDAITAQTSAGTTLDMRASGAQVN